MVTGVQIFFNSCSDPARHEEYNRWYCHTHLPDLRGANGLLGARRFANAQPESRAGQYLTTYDFESDDLIASTDHLVSIAVGLYPRRRHIDCLEGHSLGTYREIDPNEHVPLDWVDYPPSPPDQRFDAPKIAGNLPARTLSRALLIVMTNCADSARDEEYNRWYSHTHLPDLTPARGLVNATRYRRERGPSQYMALYEFEDDNLPACVADFERLAQQAAAGGRRIGISERVGLHLYIEIDASSYAPLATLDYPRERAAAPGGPVDLYGWVP